MKNWNLIDPAPLRCVDLGITFILPASSKYLVRHDSVGILVLNW